MSSTPSHRRNRRNPETQEREQKSRKGLLLKCGAGLAVVAATGAILMGSKANSADDVKDIGFTPTPAVNSSMTHNMIELNDNLIDYGWYFAGAELVGLGAYEIARRRKGSTTEGFHDFSNQQNRWPGVLALAAIMGSVSIASGIGNTAADNSAQPIREAAAIYGADSNTTPIITSYAGAFGNHMPVKVEATEEAVRQAGGRPERLIFELGKVENPSATNNPSSGPIVAIPNEILKQSIGVDMPATEKCDGLSVIVGTQLNEPVDNETHTVKNDAIADINGRPAHVKGTIPVKPGLGRVMALSSIEQIEKCVYPDSEMIIADGLTVDQVRNEVLPKLNSQLDTAYVARSFEDLVKENQNFWDGSVKPSEMNLIEQNVILGGLAIGILQALQISGRRKKYAVRMSRDVSKFRLGLSEFIAEQRDVAKATIPAIGIYALYAQMYNSSTWGITSSVNLGSLGAGFLTTAAAASITSALASWSVLRNIDVYEELKGGA
jgi:hypothetical protein